jgi:hypothetical protein
VISEMIGAEGQYGLREVLDLDASYNTVNDVMQ